MRIAQVFNNNVVLVDLDNHLQAVVKGRGIAYNKKRGDVVRASNGEKIFTLSSETSRKNLYFLLKDIPIDIITTTYEIIDDAQKLYHLDVLDYVYITLCDHIFGVFKRWKNNTYQEILLPDFHNQYPAAYEAARNGVTIINRDLEIKVPASEARNLALHFINGSGVSDDEIHFDEKDDVKLLTNIVKKSLANHGFTRSTSNADYYDRLMIHLQYLANRMRRTSSNNIKMSDEVLMSTEADYPESFRIASEIVSKIQGRLGFDVGEDEQFYFMIHIQRIISEIPVK